MTKLLIVDDHAVVRTGIKQVLKAEMAPVEFGEANDAEEALEMIGSDDWDAVILDITLPGRSGLAVLKEARKTNPDMPILVLSMHPEDQYAIRVLKAGAAGYMTKESAADELAPALRKVLDGGRYVSSTLAETLVSRLGRKVEQPSHAALSDREYEVMCLIASGKTVTEIGKLLDLSVKTISTFRSRILKKMGLRNNAELMAYAMRNDLIR